MGHARPPGRGGWSAPFGVLQFVALQLSFVGAVMKMHIVGAHVFSLRSEKKAPGGGAGSGSVGFARYLVLWNVVAAPHANLNAFKLEHVGLKLFMMVTFM